MAIGDRVRIGIPAGQNVLDSNVPAYELERGADGSVKFDRLGLVNPTVVGGVKGGELGTIVDEPAKVLKSQLVLGQGVQTAAIGLDTTLMYPIQLLTYQRVAWFPAEHFRFV